MDPAQAKRLAMGIANSITFTNESAAKLLAELTDEQRAALEHAIRTMNPPSSVAKPPPPPGPDEEKTMFRDAPCPSHGVLGCNCESGRAQRLVLNGGSDRPPFAMNGKPPIGPVVGIDETAWFSTGVRFSSEHRRHDLVVTCDHCGAEQAFAVCSRQIHPDKYSARHVGEWMINHRREHR